MLVFAHACPDDEGHIAYAQQAAVNGIHRAPEAFPVGQYGSVEHRQPHRIDFEIARELFQPHGRDGATAFREFVENDAREVGAAHAVYRRDFVSTAPQHILRAYRDAGILAAPAQVVFRVVQLVLVKILRA